MGEAFFILRIVAALFSVGFAACLGRSIAKRHIIATRRTQPASWALRTALALFALIYRTGFDALAIAALALCVLAAAGFYVWEQRPKRVEDDLVGKMFDGE